jgi:DNA-binding CsgD family transcriptional regulator
MESHARVRHLDTFSIQMLANPMRVHRQDVDAPEVAGPRCAPYREHLERFGCRYALTIAVPSSEERMLTVVMTIRGPGTRRFSHADVRSFEACAPHMVEAFAVNRATVLTKSLGRDADTLPVALADIDGRLLMTTPSFARIFWPRELPETSYLPEEAVRTLKRGRPWPLRTTEYTLYAQPDDGTGWILCLRRGHPGDQLTQRERQIAELFGRGATYKVIAERLGLAPATVRNHLQNIYAKLAVASRDELNAALSQR